MIEVSKSVGPCREVIYKQAQWQVSSLFCRSGLLLHTPFPYLPCSLQDGSTEHNVKPDGGGVEKTAKEKAKPAAEQAATSV